MTRIFHDSDADLSVLAGQTLAVVGYGNQGRSQALNLRDSGLRVIVGNRQDESAEQAKRDGFDVHSIAQACALTDTVMLLVPDEIMPAVYTDEVAPQLGAGNTLDFYRKTRVPEFSSDAPVSLLHSQGASGHA